MERGSFNQWNEKKKKISIHEKIVYPKHREIWYVSIGKNIGFESNGKGVDFKRPVLILKRIGTMFLVVSMTTKGKNNGFYYKIDDRYFNKSSFITLSQFKTIDKKRFIEKIGRIKEEEFDIIKNKIKKLF